ncbi:hypothetical protein HM1_0929 [Heliomicrobium modesticaldum Ice1]|uniref:FunZ protein n=1 Tax=Heliobacterium modesticaldum (strain ATCC 51547 / Ice1) TaxID=498761 RepID=B0TA99_HELMI|nr:hypothetical protein [Heliomicrobium modesticaldum]ABZ83636.1 hypothetical protein HM1_0929 [Heliomicrobium modesticaldum Ice1]
MIVNSRTKSEEFSTIDFGDIDGLYDKNLYRYFLDENYWENIVEKDVFFVIGRKGTGKSAIYNWIYSQQSNRGALVSNLSFKEFPFEKLLKLSDDNFSKPNQYQSIWRNIILSEIAKQIVTDSTSIVDTAFKQIKNYVDHVFGKDIKDVHKQITLGTSKTANGLKFHGEHMHEKTEQINYSDGFDNITKVNRMLYETIVAYLKVNSINRYIVQFDQLDDNYTAYTNTDSYFQALISLFKTIYDIDQSFRGMDIPVKAIAYLRSDIFNSFNNYDAESARWDQFKYFLNWSIVNRTDWNNPRLLQLINKRITNSIPKLENTNAFSDYFFNQQNIYILENGNAQQVFKYIIHRTFHRPRDFMQFCIKIQQELNQNKRLDYRTILNAEKEYSLWLLSEVANELSPKVKSLDSLYELLRLFGRNTFSITDFKSKYTRYEGEIMLDSEKLLKLLYSFGLIANVNYSSRERRTHASLIKKSANPLSEALLENCHENATIPTGKWM